MTTRTNHCDVSTTESKGRGVIKFSTHEERKISECSCRRGLKARATVRFGTMPLRQGSTNG